MKRLLVATDDEHVDCYPNKRTALSETRKMSVEKKHGDHVIDLPHSNVQVEKTEIIRLLADTMVSLGYPDCANLLAEQSQTVLETPLISKLRKYVNEGKWTSILEDVLPHLQTDQAALALAVHQVEYVEYIIARNKLVESLNVLQTRISPLLRDDAARLNELCLFLMITSESGLLELQERFNREKLLATLLEHVDISDCVPHRRLIGLLDQAMLHQINTSCTAHIYSEKMETTLLVNHCCPDISLSYLASLEGHTDEVLFVDFSPNGRWLASAGADGQVILWDMSLPVEEMSSKLKVLGTHDCAAWYLRWSPDSKYVLSVCLGKEHSSAEQKHSGSIATLWNVGHAEAVFSVTAHTEPITSCAWVNNETFVTAGLDKNCRVWNSKAELLRTIVCAEPVMDISVIIQRGVTRLAILTTDAWLRAIPLYGDEDATLELAMEQPVTSISTSSNGKYVLTNISRDAAVCAYDTETFDLVRKFKGHMQDRFVVRSAMNPANNLIATGSEDSQVYIYHISKESPKQTLLGHTAPVNDVSFAPGREPLLASASDDGFIRLWATQGYAYTPMV